MKKARLALIVSMVAFGTLAPFVRQIGLPSSEIALYRAVLAAVLTGGFLLTRSDRIPLTAMRKELPLLLLSGAAMGFNWILLFEAYKYTTVSAATLSYYFAPAIVTVVCSVLFKEKLSGRQVLCFIMSTVGMVLIVGASGLTGGGTDLIGILFGLGAAVLYATVILLNKRIQGVGGIQRTFLQFIAAAATILPYVLVTGGLHISALNTSGMVNLLIVGLLHTGVVYCLYFSALKELRGQEAAILSYIDPLVAVLISVAFLHEPMLPLQIVGGVLILGFAILNSTDGKKQ